MTNWDKLEDYDLGRIANALEELVLLAKKFLAGPAATGGKIFQLGEANMAITGTKVGGSSVFQVVWNGGMTPGGAIVWSADDPGISFAPVASDPTGNTVTATDVAADTLTSYNLTVNGIASDGTKVQATANVPLLVAPATGGTINQLS